MASHDHTDIRQLLGTREGMADLMANLTADEFNELCDALAIIASSHVPASRSFAVADIRRTLDSAAERVAGIYTAARAFHAAQRVNAAYGRAAA